MLFDRINEKERSFKIINKILIIYDHTTQTKKSITRPLQPHNELKNILKQMLEEGVALYLNNTKRILTLLGF